jgi:hypothetical protein
VIEEARRLQQQREGGAALPTFPRTSSKKARSEAGRTRCAAAWRKFT